MGREHAKSHLAFFLIVNESPVSFPLGLTGFMIAMVSALIAHICSGDPASRIIFVAVDLVLVLTSIRYVSKNDLSNEKIS